MLEFIVIFGRISYRTYRNVCKIAHILSDNGISPQSVMKEALETPHRISPSRIGSVWASDRLHIYGTFRHLYLHVYGHVNTKDIQI
jgi:hypothetical protein